MAGTTLTIENRVEGQNNIRSINAPSAAFLTYTAFTGYGSGAVVTLKDGYCYMIPVPEPASLGIVALSAAALLCRMKR